MQGNETITRKTQTIYLKWEPQDKGHFMLNTDGVLHSNLDQRGLGGVIRDYKGSWVVRYINCTPLITPLHAEFKSLIHRLKVANSLHIKPPHICSDSLELVKAMTHGHNLYANIIHECRFLL